MRFTLTVILILFSWLNFEKIFAQEIKTPPIDLQLFIEDLFAAQDIDSNYGDLYETLLQYYTNPLDLNRTNLEELRSLYILNESQLNAFAHYREKTGSLISIYELQAIPEFDSKTIQQIIPFVTVFKSKSDTRPLVQRIIEEYNNYLLLRYERTLEQKKGYRYDESLGGAAYYGDPNKLYARYRTSRSNDFSLGFTIEKDAGENIIWNDSTHRYGMDFYSFHAQIKNKGRLKNLIIGDYQIQHGQSLILGAGFNVGKGAETVNTVRRNELGIRPYTSALETGFFRGAAYTIAIGQFNVTGFYSNKLNDATIRLDENNESHFTSLQNSGFHRTRSEIMAKNEIREQNAGGIILFRSNDKNLQIGGSYLLTVFDVPLKPTARNYNQKEFKGLQNYIYGLSGSYQWQNMNFFVESAQSKSGGIGLIGGTVASLTSKLDLSIVGRSYNAHYHSFYGNAFGENTRNSNESGVYWGLKYRFNHSWTLSMYYDKFNFEWLKSQVKVPSDGSEYLAKLEYKPHRDILIKLQYRDENKLANLSSSEGNSLTIIGRSRKQNYIFNADYPANKHINFKSRFQFSTYRFNSQFSTGYTILQDISTSFNKLNLSARYALFNTDNYSNRQYVYEKDLLYAFSIPSYSGKGTRFYVVIRYKFNRHFQIESKYAITSYRDRNVISSGNEQIIGNSRQDVKLQLKISL